MIQHAATRPVPVENVADYLYSLALAMLKDDELAATAAYTLMSSPSDETIAFAASVVWRESDNDYSKQRYFSMALQKMGTRTKEHDKRFEAVNRYIDGSKASILRLVTSEYAAGFERMKNALAVDEWAGRQSKFVPAGESWPKWFGEDYDAEMRFRNGLFTARAVAESVRRRKSAVDALENYSSLLARMATPVGE
jgi:hypothetical protein